MCIRDRKHTERVLWQKIYKKSAQGRRTGVGITAEGDMLAALGLRYGKKNGSLFWFHYLIRNFWKFAKNGRKKSSKSFSDLLLHVPLR